MMQGYAGGAVYEARRIDFTLTLDIAWGMRSSCFMRCR